MDYLVANLYPLLLLGLILGAVIGFFAFTPSNDKS